MRTPMLDVEGFILVGGASSRMGTDKSRLVLNGKTTVSLITEALRPVTTNVRLVGSADPTDSSLQNIPDLQVCWGPVGGIQAALHSCQTEYCLVVACDLPFVTSQLLTHLVQLRNNAFTTFDAVVPLQSDGRPQPLCAVYKRGVCLIAAEKTIAEGEHTPRAMLDKIKTRYVVFGELAALPGSEHFFFNLNRPDDYQHAKEIAGQQPGRPEP